MDEVRQWMRDGNPVNFAQKLTPLTAAVWGRRNDVVQFLLERSDADVSLADDDGLTPMMAAILLQQADIAGTIRRFTGNRITRLTPQQTLMLFIQLDIQLRESGSVEREQIRTLMQLPDFFPAPNYKAVREFIRNEPAERLLSYAPEEDWSELFGFSVQKLKAGRLSVTAEQAAETRLKNGDAILAMLKGPVLCDARDLLIAEYEISEDDIYSVNKGISRWRKNEAAFEEFVAEQRSDVLARRMGASFGPFLQKYLEYHLFGIERFLDEDVDALLEIAAP